MPSFRSGQRRGLFHSTHTVVVRDRDDCVWDIVTIPKSAKIWLFAAILGGSVAAAIAVYYYYNKYQQRRAFQRRAVAAYTADTDAAAGRTTVVRGGADAGQEERKY